MKISPIKNTSFGNKNQNNKTNKIKEFVNNKEKFNVAASGFTAGAISTVLVYGAIQSFKDFKNDKAKQKEAVQNAKIISGITLFTAISGFLLFKLDDVINTKLSHNDKKDQKKIESNNEKYADMAERLYISKYN